LAHSRYQPGDNIVLRQGVFGSAQMGAGRIVSVLPAAQGFIHYRVRFQNENYERSIRQDDIDVVASTSSRCEPEVPANSDGRISSWINSNTIRIKK